MSKSRLIHDVAADSPELCEASDVDFLHCKRCLKELPDDTSPQDWARISICLSRDDGRIQVWCNRHNVNITTMSLVEAVS